MEPNSIAAGTLGAAFLQEGIKFLWGQAGKIIELYREKKKGEKDMNNQVLATMDDSIPEFIELSPVRSINFPVVEQKLEELKNLRKELSIYALGDEEINPENTGMLSYADQLQRLLSEVFDENVDFPRIKIQQFIENIRKEADTTGIEANTMTDGSIDVDQRVRNIEGKLTGVKLKNLGR